MSEPVVLTEVDARGVGTVTLNRPEVNNAYNGDVILGLIDAFGRLAADDACRIVVLRGNGRHFQAGADLGWLKAVSGQSPAENDQVSRNTTNACRGLNEFPKPTVALVQGGCFGGGTGIIASCDIVIASEDALFSIAEVRWGVHPGPIVPQLNAAMGAHNVRRYAMSGERFGAAEAMTMGLVHMVCPKGGLDAAAAPVVDTLLANGPEAMRACKALILDVGKLRISDAEAEELALSHSAKRQTDEAAEGFASFVQKRNPSWYPG
ncbi:MAG: enoyl-CoA hydratase-related protein [Alphaproteobacteria bacterium]